MNKSAVRGPRPGRPDTRGEIAAAAHARFLAHGYAGTTLRAVAADAGVDVALVSYHFGSKRGLFTQVMTLGVSPADLLHEVLAGERATLPGRLVDAVVAAFDEPEAQASLRALLLAALNDPALLPVVGEFLEREVLTPFADALGGGAEARARAAGAMAQIGGLVLLRHVLPVAPLADLRPDRVRRLMAPPIAEGLRPRAPERRGVIRR